MFVGWRQRSTLLCWARNFFFFEKSLSKKFRVPGGLNYYGAFWCWVLFGLYGQKEISKFLKILGVGSGRRIRKGQALGNALGVCIFYFREYIFIEHYTRLEEGCSVRIILGFSHSRSFLY